MLEEKKRRIQSLKELGIKYNLIHIVNEAEGLPKLNYFNEYSTDKIELAKKCLLNKWDFPPPSILNCSRRSKKIKKFKKFRN